MSDFNVDGMIGVDGVEGGCQGRDLPSKNLFGD